MPTGDKKYAEAAKAHREDIQKNPEKYGRDRDKASSTAPSSSGAPTPTPFTPTPSTGKSAPASSSGARSVGTTEQPYAPTSPNEPSDIDVDEGPAKG